MMKVIHIAVQLAERMHENAKIDVSNSSYRSSAKYSHDVGDNPVMC
jgi:hypothetical protein